MTQEKLLVLIDDEAYAREDPKQVPGPEFYHEKNKQDLSIEK